LICTWAVRASASPKLRVPQLVSGTISFGIRPSNIPPA
jgi:hypothetical protein